MIHMHSQRGSALLITLVVMMLIFGAIMMSVNSTLTESELSYNQMHSDQAFYVAQAGIELAAAQLENDVTWRTGYSNETFENGMFSVIILDSLVRPALKDTVLIQSVGSEAGSRSIIELYLLEEKYHPLYNHAIYAGNSDEYDPLADSQSYTSTMHFGGTGSVRDIINGDVFFNGHMDLSGDALINGDAFAGGDYTGNAPSGTSTSSTDYLAPPDLRAQNYETTADFKISTSSGWNSYGRLSSSDPRHIFVKDFRTDLAATYGYTFDNPNFFFGDPYEGSNIDRVSVSSAGNKKTYFVDGNLWIEPNGTISSLINSPPEGTQITVVVKGNIYFSDNLAYDDPDKDGLAFVAMTDGESYTDLDGDSQYDPGEPILHDDGDGIYEGPREGSGNIRFGDPNGGPLGEINGFLYAENNFEDYVLDGPDGAPQEFSVNGTLAAGNQMNIRRDYGTGHSQMQVNYDSRLKNGLLELPGLPKMQSTTSSGLVRVGWREL